MAKIRSNSPMNTPPLFWGYCIVSIVLALLPTIWTSLDIHLAELFLSSTGQTTTANTWWWVSLINGYTPFLFRILLGVSAVLWVVLWMFRRSRSWQFILAFIVIAGAVGPGFLVNSVVKDNWHRARPFQVEQFGGESRFTRAGVITDQCQKNSSFVSGHVACGFFFASLMLIDRRRRYTWAIVGALLGVAIGFSRIAAGAHWLSDELWAIPITLLSGWLVWKCLDWCWRAPQPWNTSDN
jgi:lipid A 4'-phosphatase